MNIIKKTLRLNKEEYYKKHLYIINYILPVQMTPKEIEVLAAFMCLEGDIAKDLFGTTARNMIKKQLNISSGGLGNYLNQLKLKNFIYLVGDNLEILKVLVPDKTQQGYQFKLEIIDER